MRPPARGGQRLAEILTPSLIVSLPALEANDAADAESRASASGGARGARTRRETSRAA